MSRKQFVYFTSSGVNGASAAPPLPTVEQKAMTLSRILVGHSSPVYTYKLENATVVNNFPMKKNAIDSTFISDGRHFDAMIEMPPIESAIEFVHRLPHESNKQ